MEILIGILLVTGSLFLLITAWGLIKLPDFYIRMSVITKSLTIGIGWMLLAVLIHFGTWNEAVKVFIVWIFLFLSTPVSGHLGAKIAARFNVRFREGTKLADFIDYLNRENDEDEEVEERVTAKKLVNKKD